MRLVTTPRVTFLRGAGRRDRGAVRARPHDRRDRRAVAQRQVEASATTSPTCCASASTRCSARASRTSIDRGPRRPASAPTPRRGTSDTASTSRRCAGCSSSRSAWAARPPSSPGCSTRSRRLGRAEVDHRARRRDPRASTAGSCCANGSPGCGMCASPSTANPIDPADVLAYAERDPRLVASAIVDVTDAAHPTRRFLDSR